MRERRDPFEDGREDGLVAQVRLTDDGDLQFAGHNLRRSRSATK
jgi:hypothetical protein